MRERERKGEREGGRLDTWYQLGGNGQNRTRSLVGKTHKKKWREFENNSIFLFWRQIPKIKTPIESFFRIRNLVKIGLSIGVYLFQKELITKLFHE